MELLGSLVWYLPKHWHHPSGTKKERKIKAKKANEHLEKAQSKAAHTTAVASVLLANSSGHMPL